MKPDPIQNSLKPNADNLPQRFADAHRLLTFGLQSARHRLGWMGLIYETDEPTDAAAAAAIAKMESLERELLVVVPDIAKLPQEALVNLMRFKRREISRRWAPQILDDCYTRYAFLTDIEGSPYR